MDGDRSALVASAAILAVSSVLRVWCANTWGLVADEAWYAAWSTQLDWGFYDQPPLIAWVLAWERMLFGQSDLGLRVVPLLCGLWIPLVLWYDAGDRPLWSAWCGILPALAWFTLFATPDALLLAAWAGGMAGALRGGRGWWFAGLCAGLAFEAKHTGALLFPLLLLGARPHPRNREPWVGAALALVLALPNLWWNAQHDWVTVRFQLHEGLLHPDTPGALGVVLQLVGQVGMGGGMLGGLGLLWVVLRPDQATPIPRLAWWTSAPLLAGFALAAAFAPGDAHWPAPAWIGIGLGVSHAPPRWRRAGWLGVGLFAPLVAVVLVHASWPVTRLPADPATRLTEGPVLAAAVARVVAPGERGEVPAVLGERYQEVGFLRWYAGLEAVVAPGCGRPGQQDLWPAIEHLERAVFLRPATGGPPDCVLADWLVVRGPVALELVDAGGRRLGPWQLFELEAR